MGSTVRPLGAVELIGGAEARRSSRDSSSASPCWCSPACWFISAESGLLGTLLG
jgi:hypothetical protein